MTRLEDPFPPEVRSRIARERREREEQAERQRAIMREANRMSLGGRIFLSIFIPTALIFIVWLALNPPDHSGQDRSLPKSVAAAIENRCAQVESSLVEAWMDEELVARQHQFEREQCPGMQSMSYWSSVDILEGVGTQREISAIIERCAANSFDEYGPDFDSVITCVLDRRIYWLRDRSDR